MRTISRKLHPAPSNGSPPLSWTSLHFALTVRFEHGKPSPVEHGSSSLTLVFNIYLASKLQQVSTRGARATVREPPYIPLTRGLGTRSGCNLLATYRGSPWNDGTSADRRPPWHSAPGSCSHRQVQHAPLFFAPCLAQMGLSAERRRSARHAVRGKCRSTRRRLGCRVSRRRAGAAGRKGDPNADGRDGIAGGDCQDGAPRVGEIQGRVAQVCRSPSGR